MINYLMEPDKWLFNDTNDKALFCCL